MNRLARTMPFFPALLSALLSCNNPTSSSDAGNNSSANPSDNSAAPVTQSPSEVQRESTLPSTSTTPTTRTFAVDFQANHPNGTTLRVTGVAATETNTSVTMTVTNGHNRAIKLCSQPKSMLLRDDQNNVYNLVAPPNNRQVEVESGKTLEGTFSFAGRLHPQAKRVTLVTNDRYGSTEADYAINPKLTIEINLTQTKGDTP